jgi:hypothetical protein
MPAFTSPVALPYAANQSMYNDKNVKLKILATYINIKDNTIFYEVNNGISTYITSSLYVFNAAQNQIYQTNKLNNDYAYAQKQLDKLNSL